VEKRLVLTEVWQWLTIGEYHRVGAAAGVVELLKLDFAGGDFLFQRISRITSFYLRKFPFIIDLEPGTVNSKTVFNSERNPFSPLLFIYVIMVIIEILGNRLKV
jgi:hypothetical protein